MRTNRVTPKGIIRITGEHDAGDGACDEVINLRYEQGSMRLCGKKGLLATSTTIFLAFYRHRLPGVDKYIGIYVKNGHLKVSTVTIDNGVATPDAERASNPVPAIKEFLEGDTIDVKFINNLLIISSENEHKIYTFYYLNGEYAQLSDGTLPEIQLGVVKEDYFGGMRNRATANFYLDGVAQKYKTTENLTLDTILADVNAGLSFARHRKNKYRTEGWVAVCATMTLFDGSETKPTQPVWYYLGGRPTIMFGGDSQSGPEGSMFISQPTSSLTVNVAAVMGSGTFADTYATYKNLIKSINIYSTYPKTGIDLEKSLENIRTFLETTLTNWSKKNPKGLVTITPYTYYDGGNSSNPPTFSYVEIDTSELDKELFHLQKSIPFSSSYSDITGELVRLDFSDTSLSGKLMDAENSGYIRRFGKMMTYNSRLHLFDIDNTFKMPGDGGNPDGLFGPSWMRTADNGDASDFASDISRWTDNTQWSGVSPSITGRLARVVVKTRKEGAMLQCSRLIQIPVLTYDGVSYAVLRAIPTVTDADSEEATLYTLSLMANIPLRSSNSYNFSYAEPRKAAGAMWLKELYNPDYQQAINDLPGYANANGIVPDGYFSASYEYVCLPLQTTTFDWEEDIPSDTTEYSEDDTVVVSAQNNPTYFSPENSYRIGGKVLAVSPNSEAVSDVQVGQYPLAVFTDNGIYTLIQGDGKVLYSNVAKIAEDVMKEGSSVLPTTYGITFLSGDGVFTLVGRKCVRISLALDGPPDWDIRQCEQYIRAHECTEHHLAAWKQPGGTFIYTDNDEPAVGNIAYDKYGDPLPLRISAVSGQTVTYDGTVYTYSQDDNRNLLYNVAPYLSDDFRDEIADVSKVRLLFDAYKAELILSITDRPYSYVYSFVERQWHKITETFAFGSEALALVYPPVATGASPTCEIRNVNDETFGINEPVMVHLQTRCVKFGTESYKAVHRLLGRVNVNNTHDYNIPNGDITGMYLYASRDLRHWSMVGLYQHKGYTDLMHVNKTAAHFKYFLITFGGKLIKDSEITGFDADVLYRYQDKER